MKAKTEAMMTLKALMEKHGAEGIFEILAEAAENLAGAANAQTEIYAWDAAKEVARVGRTVKRAELVIDATMAASLEILIEAAEEKEAAEGAAA